MSKPSTLGNAVSAIALGSLLAGCAAPSGQGLRSAPKTAQLGPATRAMMALNANDPATAVAFAEQATAANPHDAAVRALLGTAYFAAGRCASAETAYEDALSLNSSDPKVVLKLALVQVAQGKNGEALTLLHAARTSLESADYGLALALAGQPFQAITVLEPAARVTGADSRVRQNLALSYALAGDWTAARTVAAQDVPADQLDSRIQQWMKLASPTRAYDQVAALTGVRPVADPGQPVRLALRPNSNGTALAAAEDVPSVEPLAVAAPLPVAAPSLAAVAAPVAAAPSVAAPSPAPMVAQAQPAYVPPFRAEPVEAPKAKPVAVAEAPFVDIAKSAPAPKAAVARPKAVPTIRAAAFVPKRAAPKPTIAQGRSTAVVQIGAYGSPQRVAQAWNAAGRRHAALRNFVPVSARFNSAQGIVYRLSVKGFSSPDQAKNLCVSLRRAGGNCFVRNVAGDAPVRFASR